jgi:hypothetical protein
MIKKRPAYINKLSRELLLVLKYGRRLDKLLLKWYRRGQKYARSIKAMDEMTTISESYDGYKLTNGVFI